MKESTSIFVHRCNSNITNLHTIRIFSYNLCHSCNFEGPQSNLPFKSDVNLFNSILNRCTMLASSIGTPKRHPPSVAQDKTANKLVRMVPSRVSMSVLTSPINILQHVERSQRSFGKMIYIHWTMQQIISVVFLSNDHWASSLSPILIWSRLDR